MADIAHPPDRVRTVVGDQQCAVARCGNAYRAAPYLTVCEHESGQEVFVPAVGPATPIEQHPDHFVPGANGFVPGAVLGGKQVPPVLLGELLTPVEGDLQRGVVRLEQYVWCDDEFL